MTNGKDTNIIMSVGIDKIISYYQTLLALLAIIVRETVHQLLILRLLMFGIHAVHNHQSSH